MMICMRVNQKSGVGALETHPMILFIGSLFCNQLQPEDSHVSLITVITPF